MSWLLIVLAALLLVWLERKWMPHAIRSLTFRGGPDRLLAEPGDRIVWSSTVENHSRLPIPYVRLTSSFPTDALLIAEEKWATSHCLHSITQWHVKEIMSLRSRQSCTRTVSFSFQKRGYYPVGSYHLSAGDILGFTEITKTGDWQGVVVMPERSRQKTSIDALGSFLGDISVRRFIMEDPILTLGFRDYTGREPMKAISWTRTAVTGSLQVKQYDHTAEQHVTILLNTEGASPDQLEECFRLMRSACELLEQKKISYGFRTNGHLVGPTGNLFWLPEGLGTQHLNTILYGLGRGDGTCFRSFRYLTGQTLKHRKGNESYVVITPPPDDRVRACIRKLEEVVDGGICVLIGEGTVTV